MKHGVSARYMAMIARGEIERDAAQKHVVERLDKLGEALAERQLASKGSALGWLFGSRTVRPAPVRGLYIWGDVGRGKTMLMDLFHDSLQVKGKRRAHFHAFMSDVHERIHAWRQKAKTGEVKGSDPVKPVAQAIASETPVLCFDELAVTDIADAMLLGRLFETLFAEGVTVIATSNRSPNDLYKDGLNRSLFVPFIDMIEQKLDVVRLEARTDYRLEKLGGADVYLVPADAKATVALDAMFHRLTGGAAASEARLKVKGRDVVLPLAAQGVARATFADLCEKPLGALDYLAIAQDFHTLIVDDVPAMSQEKRNAAKRFIILIDVLYDHNVKTVISAAAPAQNLYEGTTGAEAFEFDRTVSRLIDMRSDDYLSRPHGRNAAPQDPTSAGIVET